MTQNLKYRAQHLTLVANESHESRPTDASAIYRVATAATSADAPANTILAVGAARTRVAAGAAQPSWSAGASSGHAIAGGTEMGKTKEDNFRGWNDS